MKISKFSSTSILIVLALLLSGADMTPRPVAQGSGPASSTSSPPAPVIQGARPQIAEERVTVLVAPVTVNRDWLDYINPALTLLLVFVGAAYAILMKRQLRSIDQQARIANHTLIETRKAAEAAATNAETARQALLLNTRAVVEIHGVNIVENGMELAASITIMNTGPTAAKVLQQGFHFWFRDKFEPWPPDAVAFAPSPTLVPERLESQERVYATLTIEAAESQRTVPGNAGLSRWHAYTNGAWNVCLAGRVQYLDESGKVHETSFCQRWEPVRGRFVASDNMPSLYNYRG